MLLQLYQHASSASNDQRDSSSSPPAPAAAAAAALMLATDLESSCGTPLPYTTEIRQGAGNGGSRKSHTGKIITRRRSARCADSQPLVLRTSPSEAESFVPTAAVLRKCKIRHLIQRRSAKRGVRFPLPSLGNLPRCSYLFFYDCVATTLQLVLSGKQETGQTTETVVDRRRLYVYLGRDNNADCMYWPSVGWPTRSEQQR